MVLRSFSIFDSKIGAFHPPFFAPTDGSAVRSFQDLVNDQSTSISRHPRDYSLWCLGVWNDSTGRMEAFDHNVQVVEAHALIITNGQPSLFEREEV